MKSKNKIVTESEKQGKAKKMNEESMKNGKICSETLIHTLIR